MPLSGSPWRARKKEMGVCPSQESSKLPSRPDVVGCTGGLGRSGSLLRPWRKQSASRKQRQVSAQRRTGDGSNVSKDRSEAEPHAAHGVTPTSRKCPGRAWVLLDLLPDGVTSQ